MTGVVIEYLGVAVLAALVAATELMGRYRDSLRRLLKVFMFWAYLVVNVAAGVAALALARASGWTFGSGSSVRDASIARVLAAGLAGLAVLRSGVAIVRVGERDIPAGLGALVTGLLAISEREIDRSQGLQRSTDVGLCMKGVSFDRAYKVLPKHCLLLLRSSSPEETQALAAAVAEIAEDTSSSDQAKAYNLGVALINFAGPDVLAGAIDTLRAEISAPAGASAAAERPGQAQLYVVE